MHRNICAYYSTVTDASLARCVNDELILLRRGMQLTRDCLGREVDFHVLPSGNIRHWRRNVLLLKPRFILLPLAFVPLSKALGLFER